MINLKKQKSKVILKKENTYSSNRFTNRLEIGSYSYNRFANRLKLRALASKDFMEEFWEGPYFNQQYFRGPWTWLCSFMVAMTFSSLVIPPLCCWVVPYLEKMGMDFLIAIIFVVIFGHILLTFFAQFLATLIKRKYEL